MVVPPAGSHLAIVRLEPAASETRDGASASEAAYVSDGVMQFFKDSRGGMSNAMVLHGELRDSKGRVLSGWSHDFLLALRLEYEGQDICSVDVPRQSLLRLVCGQGQHISGVRCPFGFRLLSYYCACVAFFLGSVFDETAALCS